MKVHQIVVTVLDFEDMGLASIEEQLENNRHLSVSVRMDKSQTRDIGMWDDSHPLNHRDKADAELKRLFD